MDIAIPSAAVAESAAPRRWRVPRRAGWLLASALVAGLVLAPVGALIWIALGGSVEGWSHLAAYVLPRAMLDTALLLAGVAVIVTVIGSGTAWLVTAYDFPGRRALDWALLLPLAVPTYIVAYVYLDLLHPIGPVQSAIRALLGYSSPRELRLPDIRSVWGCALLLGFVLYPYVYLPTRALFLMQAASLVEVSRTLGLTRRAVFARVALPLARPAIALGLSLALMEALNDIGASEFLGVRTLAVSIYSTWVNRSDLPGAAQIALMMLAIVLALVLLERWARRRRAYPMAAQRPRQIAPTRLEGAAGWGALALVSCPVLLGFAAPAGYLAVEAAKRIEFAGLSVSLGREVFNTVVLATAATAVAVVLGAVVAFGVRFARGPVAPALARCAGLGYAVPGTVLAIGLLAPLASLDALADEVASRVWGPTGGFLLLGSGAALVFAYVVRFLTIPIGSAEAALSKISPSLDRASRVLGRTSAGTLVGVHLPLTRTALASAALLVFVDCVKELPATMLLRPLNVETLATHLYGEAARGTYEDGAVAALLIVAIGLLPVMLLSWTTLRAVIAPTMAAGQVRS